MPWDLVCVCDSVGVISVCHVAGRVVLLVTRSFGVWLADLEREGPNKEELVFWFYIAFVVCWQFLHTKHTSSHQTAHTMQDFISN